MLEIMFIFMNIIAGLEYLHSLNVINSDLNPKNIFIVNNQRNIVRIGDIGFATTENIKSKMDFNNKYSQESEIFAIGKILEDILEF